MLLGKQVYFIDFKDKKVNEGIIIETHVSTGGYPACLLKVGNDTRQTELALVYDTKEQADAQLHNKLECSDMMNRMVKDTNDKLNELRKHLFGGEPTLKHLVEKK